MGDGAGTRARNGRVTLGPGDRLGSRTSHRTRRSRTALRGNFGTRARDLDGLGQGPESRSVDAFINFIFFCATDWNYSFRIAVRDYTSRSFLGRSYVRGAGFKVSDSEREARA